TAATLVVGDIGFSDTNVTISGTGMTRHAGYNTLAINTGFSLTQSAPLSVANLAVRGQTSFAGGSITLTNAGNDVDTLAFNNTGSGAGASSYTDANALTIGSVNGLTASSNTGTTTTLNAGGNLFLNANVTSSGTLSVTSTGGAVTENGTNILTAP